MARLVLFAAVGAVGTGVQYILLFVLVNAGMGSVSASMIGAVAGALTNYALNHQLTFRSQRCHSETMPRYFAVAAVGLLFNGSLMTVLTPKMHYLFAQTIATGAVLIWNYGANCLWTFREEDYAR